MKRNVLVTVAVLLLPMICFSQDKSKKQENVKSEFTLSRVIELDSQTGVENVYINIEPNTDGFEFRIESSIFSGDVNIEIFDPSNDSMGKYSVKSQVKSAKKETVNGNLNLEVNEPMSGKWLVKIKPESATGQILMQYRVK